MHLASHERGAIDWDKVRLCAGLGSWAALETVSIVLLATHKSPSPEAYIGMGTLLAGITQALPPANRY